MSITVAIVEDNPEIRSGLAYLINSSPRFECRLTCASAEEALREIPIHQPDIVLMDIQLPGISGIDCIRELKRIQPGLLIMILTVFEDHDRIFQSLAAGASGYLLKNTPPAKLLQSIEDLHEGGSPMSNQIARRVVDAFQKWPKPNPAVAHLSRREQEILDHLTRGFLYKEIAGKLGISIETVRTHVRNIYEKLQVRSRAEATMSAYPYRTL